MLLNLSRQMVIGGVVGIAAIATASTASAQFRPSATECIAPAGVGGGWDFTCRSVGKALSDLDLVPGQVAVTNLSGGGGGVAFASVVSGRGDDNDLLVAASTATVTRLAQGLYADATADQVRWVGSLGADFGIIGVAVDSEIQSLSELMDMVIADPSSVAFAGGSAAGGFDHLKILQVAVAAGMDDVTQVKYVAFDGGGEAVTQLVGGFVQAFSGDISEATGFIRSGDMRVIAVLSEVRLPGEFDNIATAREQGLDVVSPNWRGFYTPVGASQASFDYWSEALKTIAASSEWQEVMTNNGLMPFAKSGADFQSFIDQQLVDIETLSRDIGIID